ncbi:MAG: hypothetical protein Pars2KO_16700 [Parasphingorhabdus sp.]
MLRIIFWLLVAGILGISTMPAQDAPTVFADDKLNHLLAFFVLSFMARIVWLHFNSVILFILLATFGGAIEMLQFSMGFGRDADWGDFAADVVAIIIGMSSAHLINKMRNKTSIE